MREICLKTPERRRSGDLTVNFKQILHIVVVFPMGALNK